MSENFSQALENAMQKISEMKIEMNVKDILKSLGIFPDFLKKK